MNMNSMINTTSSVNNINHMNPINMGNGNDVPENYTQLNSMMAGGGLGLNQMGSNMGPINQFGNMPMSNQHMPMS